MFSDGILTFLSQDNLTLHTSYIKRLKHKLSILEKSYEGIKGKSIRELMRAKLPSDIKTEALELLSDIESHKLFFDSFTDKHNKCNVIRGLYPSEESFLYEVYEKAMRSHGDFLYILLDTREHPLTVCDVGLLELYPRYTPKLCIDLSEHSYFLDYGFEREGYIRAAVSHLDLIKLTNA